MLMSSISVTIANTAVDPNAAYGIIGFVILFFIIMAIIASPGKKLKKKYCPYCRRQINYSSPLIRPVKPIMKSPLATRGQVNKPILQNGPRPIYPRVNAPVLRKGTKMYCPYCKGQL